MRILIDNGNETSSTPRIVLSNQLGPIGLGSTGTGAPVHAEHRGHGPGRQDVARVAAAGRVSAAKPIKPQARGRSLNDTGWSFQSERMVLSPARR